MSKVYYVLKCGIYNHGVHGIFDDKVLAIAACKKCAKLDTDDYHVWLVNVVDLNKEQLSSNDTTETIFECRKQEINDD